MMGIEALTEHGRTRVIERLTGAVDANTNTLQVVYELLAVVLERIDQLERRVAELDGNQ